MSERLIHFYRCFGCGKEHAAEFSAMTCCAVVQEIFQCGNCATDFPSESKFNTHQCRLSHYVETRTAAEYLRDVESGKYRELDNGDDVPIQTSYSDFSAIGGY